MQHEKKLQQAFCRWSLRQICSRGEPGVLCGSICRTDGISRLLLLMNF